MRGFSQPESRTDAGEERESDPPGPASSEPEPGQSEPEAQNSGPDDPGESPASTETGVCGDGRVDPPEVCDDANTIGRDGCEPDCTLSLGADPAVEGPRDAGLDGEAAIPPASVSCDTESAPCGGDVVGTWNALDCSLELTGAVNLNGFGLGCANAPITSGSLTVGGTFIADADGNVLDETTLQGEQEFHVSAECLSVGVIACERLEAPFAALGYDTVACVDDAQGTGGCTCTGTFNQQGGLAKISFEPVKTGGFTTEGTTLTTFDGGNNTSLEYCSSEGVMVWAHPEPTTVGTLEGPVVLWKE